MTAKKSCGMDRLVHSGQQHKTNRSAGYEESNGVTIQLTHHQLELTKPMPGGGSDCGSNAP
jgi:hypothetical protein